MTIKEIFSIKFNYLSYLFLFIFLVLMSQKVVMANQNGQGQPIKNSHVKIVMNTKVAPEILENNKKETYPKDIQAIIDKGKIVIAMYHIDSFPFYYVNDAGDLTGVDVEFIKGFARLLGVDAVFDRSSKYLDNTVDKVIHHEADLAISKLSITFSRVKRTLFSKPYLKLHPALLINRLLLAKQMNGRSREETLKNLQGRIGVVAKSSYVKYAKQKFKNIEVVGFSSWQDAIKAVLKGEVIGLYRDEVEVQKVIQDKPDRALKLLSVVLKDVKDPKGIAMAADKRHLKTLLDFYIDSLDLELTSDKVLNKYKDVINSIETKTK